MKMLKPFIIPFILACIGLAVFVALLDRFVPVRAANVRISRSQAIETATGFMEENGYDLSDYHVLTTMGYDDEAFIFLQQQYGLHAAQDMVRYKPHRGLAFFWNVTWFQNLPQGAPQERFTVLLSGRGELAGFSHEFPQSFEWPQPEQAHLSEEKAFEIAMVFLESHEIDVNDFEDDIFTSNRRPNRTDHIFRWRNASEFNDSYAELMISVQGDEVGRFRISFNIPEKAATLIKQQSANEYFIDVVVAITVFFFLGLMALVVFLKKYHEGEVEVRTGALFFLVVTAAFILQAVLKFRISSATWTIGELSRDGIALFLFILLVLIIRPIMSWFGLAGWSAGESYGREVFSDKFVSIDSLVHKRFFTINLARSTLQGYLSGFIGLGLIAVLSWLALQIFGCTTRIGGYQTVVSAPGSFLMPLLYAVSGGLLAEILFRLFLNLFIHRHLKLKWLAVLISSVFWAFYAPGFWGINISLYPLQYELVVWFIIGLYLGFVFWKYDVMTVLLANFVMMGVMQALPLITSEAGDIFRNGVIALALLALPLIPMVIGFIRRETFTMKAERLPAHIRRIAERVRMAKELEIARQVQMRLLPKLSPHMPGFEISGVCIPARETGGDYFDFIELGDNRLGIVIGDVSGKGVPAAIYMTLTKGIVQSHADDFVSPKEVLIKVNDLLYKTIDKDSFVSLFYAILDCEKKTIVYSRAGHNPVLYFDHKDSECQLLEPDGLALGLEQGLKFREVIKEKEIQLNPGDLLVFYTDGFTEAMNSRREEYGEDQLMRIIQAHHHESVDLIYEAVIRDIKRFVKEAPQHDDMTMIFIKGDAA